MIDAALRKDFDRDGFVVLRGALARSRIDSLLAECRGVFRRQFVRHGISGGVEDFDDSRLRLFRVAMPTYLAAAKATQYLPSLHRLGASDAVLGLVGKLGIACPVISTRPVVHIVAEDLRVPGGYHRTPPHQDWRSVQGSLDAVVLWLPLAETGPDCAPLELIPGSHRHGLYPAEPHPFGNRVAEGTVDESAFRAVTAGQGDAVAFSMFLVHRTGLRQRSGVRWSVSFRFNNLDEPSFVERDYPNPYVYRPREDLLHPGFPGKKDLRAIFGGE